MFRDRKSNKFNVEVTNKKSSENNFSINLARVVTDDKIV